MEITPTVEDYLKTIFYLQKDDGAVSTSSLAEKLRIKDASVSAMIKKLARHNYLNYSSHRGVNLTDSGKKIALSIIRKHRLLEIYLNERLNVSSDNVHGEAEKLEHYVSEDIMKSIEQILGKREFGIHGEKIPEKVPVLNNN
jgi:DtxR family Mn-dependent transcriptional regulator